jgi:flavin-dependent dehydrogenase
LEAIGRHVGWAFGKYKMHDIAIIGAGPAGATLARLIGKQYKVLLVDNALLSTNPTALNPTNAAAGCWLRTLKRC